MNPSLNFSLDLQSLTATHPVPASLAERLETLCQALVTLYDGRPGDPSAVGQNLSGLVQWLKTRSPGGPDDPDWTVMIVSLPDGAGGTATFQDPARSMQSLMLSLDGSGQPIVGIWQSLAPGSEARAFTFQIERQAGQWALVLDDGRQQQRQALPGTAASLGWGSIAAFAGQLMGVIAPPAEPPAAAAPAPAPPESKRQQPAEAPKPTRPQPAATCSSCGTPLSPGARFCPNCGSSTQPAAAQQPAAPVEPAGPPPWYFMDKGKQAGPIDDATFRRWVRERRIRPETRVWTATLSGWVEARQAGLFEQPASPPAVPPPPAAPPPPPALKWYYLDQGSQVGPVDDATFRRWFAERRLGPDTMVWNPTLPGWIKARQAGLG